MENTLPVHKTVLNQNVKWSYHWFLGFVEIKNLPNEDLPIVYLLYATPENQRRIFL